MDEKNHLLLNRRLLFVVKCHLSSNKRRFSLQTLERILQSLGCVFQSLHFTLQALQ